MRRRHQAPGQVVRKLRQADRMLGEGMAVVEVCTRLEVTVQASCRWRSQVGGMRADDAKRLKEPGRRMPA